MKSIHLLLLVILLGAQPLLSHAQVYKWKDKDGSIRYTDTPPPSNIKQEAIGKKTVEPTGKAPLSAVDPGMKVPPELKNNAPAVKAEDAAAEIRQSNAEAEKKDKQDSEKREAVKAANCKTAKANLENYMQGGRIYKINEKGEREYIGDNDLKQGKAQAQNEINENCN
jgi:Domain of unknown function (DUF4124)